MFYEASAFNGDISNWNVTSMTSLSTTFKFASSFHGDISAWVLTTGTPTLTPRGNTISCHLSVYWAGFDSQVRSSTYNVVGGVKNKLT
jgi:surface protein